MLNIIYKDRKTNIWVRGDRTHLPNDQSLILTAIQMLVDSDVYACIRLMLEGKQGYETRARVPVSTVARSILDMNATK